MTGPVEIDAEVVAAASKGPTWCSTLLGLTIASVVGSVIALAQYLTNGHDLRGVPLPILFVMFPLVGGVLGWVVRQNPEFLHWRRPAGFFAPGRLSSPEAAARGRRVRRSMAIGFGAGVILSLVATGLDFLWRGWPFLLETQIGSLVGYPFFGLLLGYNLGLRQGNPKPSVHNIRIRMGTMMVVVAYFALLFGLGTAIGRYSITARIHHAKALNARTMATLFETQAARSVDALKRADNAKELRAGRIPDGILPEQKAFLKSLDTASEETRRYRYELIADGEDLQARLASQNVQTYSKLVDYYRWLAVKYDQAERRPWVPVPPDPPIPQ